MKKNTVKNAAIVPESSSAPEVPVVPEVNPLNDAVNDLVTTAIDAESSAMNVWNKTGFIINMNGEMFTDTEKKVMSKNFTSLLNKHADISAIPATGESRSGEVIELRKTNGKIKWSSWVATARIVQNTSDIFKGIEVLGYDEVFPEGTLISRYELLALLKDAKPSSSETPAETIIRCLELVNKKIAELDKADTDSIDQRLIETNVLFANWKA